MNNIEKKVKKISKYITNILAFINALILVLSPIWGWHLDKITDTIIAVNGVIAVYLVGGKIFENKEPEEQVLYGVEEDQPELQEPVSQGEEGDNEISS